MFIRIRTTDGKDTKIDISKCTTSLEDLQEKIENTLNIAKENQVLYFSGKQLVNNNKLIDYGIDQNHVLILRVKTQPSGDNPVLKETSESSQPEKLVLSSTYFKVGDLVDGMDEDGSWSSGKIVKIVKRCDGTDELDHMISFYDSPESVALPLENIRPRMERIVKLSDVNVGDKVLVNYNVEEPKKRGHWYIMTVTETPQGRSRRLLGTLFPSDMEKCEVRFKAEIYHIEEPKLVQDRTSEDDEYMKFGNGEPRLKPISCTSCYDDPLRRCKECSCVVCGGKEDEHLQLLCQECEDAYHTTCLNPPLEAVPEDDWYCPNCRNTDVIVQPGEALKMTKRRLNQPSAHQEKPARDWGKGMACVGRTKKCTIVKENHFGEIPGVEVGTSWKYRITASEAGVHRPPVSGIHGRESEGAYSIVLSGGYEDDVDDGLEFLYTGSGGRDLSGNKRTSEQSCDQELTRMNLALAMNCNAPINKEHGAEAQDWKRGKPVRVLRKQKSKKHPSKYAPEEGFRYDGLYKIVKYFPVKGASGYRVWRYLLRRDDPVPPPWTPEGQTRIQKLGLKLIVPDGFEEKKKQTSPSAKSKKRGQKPESGGANSPQKKKKKNDASEPIAYELPNELLKSISKDSLNKLLWDNIKNSAQEGKPKFIEAVQQAFLCVCCLELVHKPVTTECKHTMCQDCLNRAVSSIGHTCPHCRFDLGEEFKISINKALSAILSNLFPGYGNGR